MVRQATTVLLGVLALNSVSLGRLVNADALVRYDEGVRLLEDFGHFAVIRRPDLATRAGLELLQVDHSTFERVIGDSPPKRLSRVLDEADNSPVSAPTSIVIRGLAGADSPSHAAPPAISLQTGVLIGASVIAVFFSVALFSRSIAGKLIARLGGGLALAVLVALVSQWSSRTIVGPIEHSDVDQSWWRRHAPSGYEREPRASIEVAGFGVHGRVYLTPSVAQPHFTVAQLLAIGWPLPLLRGERWFRSNDFRTAATATTSKLTWAVDLGGAGAVDDMREWRIVPLRPVWSGIAVNTAVAVLVVAVLDALKTMILTIYRRAHGRCATCGYPISSSRRCPECGADRKR